MKWFRKEAKTKIRTEQELAELTRQHKARVAEIEAEVERGNFEKADKMAATCAEDFKGNDPYGEAFCRWLVGHSVICQYLKDRSVDQSGSKNTGPIKFSSAKISSSNHMRARSYLLESAAMFEVLAKNRKYERNRKLSLAMAFIDLAMLESFAEDWNRALAACKLSADISRKYEDRQGLQLATELALLAKTERLGTEIFRFADKLVSVKKKDQNPP